MYIKIDKNNRVLYCAETDCLDENGKPLIKVDDIPDGNIIDYIYIDGEFVYNPVPENDYPVELTVEERLTVLEKTISVPEYEAGKWYYRGDMVKFDGKTYSCIAPENVVCVWSPLEYPQYWKEV